MGFDCRVVTDSVSPAGIRLSTMELTYPRIIHSEIMTHRQFSRNSASSRAIPVKKMMQKVREDPFIPIHWGKNQRGMQAEQEVSASDQSVAELYWRTAWCNAIAQAENLFALGIHKQIANRLLEPFAWHTVVITATEWSNFFAQRCHPDAEPHMRKIAEMIRDALAASEPEPLPYGAWHLPYIKEEDYAWVAENAGPEALFFHIPGEKRAVIIDELAKISVARCARVSYLTQEGVRDPAKDLELFERLLGGMHMSPLEHVATPAMFGDTRSNMRGWWQLRKWVKNECR